MTTSARSALARLARLLGLTAALPLAAGLAGCEGLPSPGRPDAVGAPSEILVVTDSATWTGPVGDALRAELGQPVPTMPGNEGAFALRRQALTPQFYDGIRRQRAVVFAATLADSSNVGDFLRARFGEASLDRIRQGRALGVALSPDLWYDGQLVAYLTAPTDSALVEAIRARGDTLRAAFGALALANTGRDIFERERQTDLEERLMRDHGFAVNVQYDYFVSQDTTTTFDGQTGHFVRLRRVLSDTWRDWYVYYEDHDPSAPIDTARLEALTDTLGARFLRGTFETSYVTVDRRRPTVTEAITLAGRPALATRGLWRMTDDFMGGPFVRYAFVEPEQERLYVFYGMVFAPRYPKRDFLRQIEATAHTFRTAADAPPDAMAAR